LGVYSFGLHIGSDSSKNISFYYFNKKTYKKSVANFAIQISSVALKTTSHLLGGRDVSLKYFTSGKGLSK
jgi:hypothetical protein